MASKTEILRILCSNDKTAILAYAKNNKRLLSYLTGLTYHPDPQIADRAVAAFGTAAWVIAGQDPEFVRNQLRRLFWLVNDESGGIGWRAPELIASVLVSCPGLFDEFISPLVYLLDLEPEDAPRFWTSVLASIERLAQVRPGDTQFAIPLLEQIKENDPPIREQVDRCLMILRSHSE